jgi:dTDP-glucose 4,6-dehydratase
MILVTGAAGFIGSNMCFKLAEQGAEVLGIDNETPQSNKLWIKVLENSGKMNYKRCSLRNLSALRALFYRYKITEIVHLAAETSIDRSIENPLEFWENNLIGTHNLFTTALKRHVTKIVCPVTASAYGSKSLGEAVEGDALRPSNPYSASMAGMYLDGKSLCKVADLPAVFAFPVNVFGPRQNKEKFIPKTILKLLKGDKVPLMKSTEVQRDWLPVDDMCSALLLLLEKGVIGEDYNIGAGNYRTNSEVVERILNLTNRDESFVEIVDNRIAHDFRYAVNSDKIKSLGWEVKNTFDTYLENTVDWYGSNKYEVYFRSHWLDKAASE